jgi:uncharacterized protein
MTTTLHQPIPTGKRIALIDALRGLALLGIILANVPTSSALSTSQYFLLDSRPFNDWLEALMHILISTKFITIFSILFGFGFYNQLNRAAERGIHFQKYFSIRMLLLFLIGCLHAYALWFGDIIRYYAICGLLLLLFHQVSTRRLLVWALVFMVPLTAITFILNGVFDLQQYTYDRSIVSRLFEVTDYGTYLRYNATIDPMVNFIQDSPLTFFSCFGKILFGYWLGRIQFFSQVLQHEPMLKKWITWGFVGGLAGSIGYWAVTAGKLELDLPLLWLPFLIAAGLILHTLFYIACFVKAFYTSRGQKVLMLFAPIGQMALTNYLLQTVFYLIFFYRWTFGFALTGKISLAETHLLVLLFFGCQVLFSWWWLKHYAQGPVEYVWKKLSYQSVRSGSSVVPQTNKAIIE